MGEFAHGLQERVAETRRSLAAARENGDDYGVEVHGEELADLVRLAQEHGLDVDAAPTADLTTTDLTTTGLTTIDLTTTDRTNADGVRASAC